MKKKKKNKYKIDAKMKKEEQTLVTCMKNQIRCNYEIDAIDRGKNNTK